MKRTSIIAGVCLSVSLALAAAIAQQRSGDEASSSGASRGGAGAPGGYGSGPGGMAPGGGYGGSGIPGSGGAYGGYDGPSLDARANQLLGQWQAADDEQARQELEGQLRTALERSFRQRLASHEQEVSQLEERVGQLRAQVDRRRERSDGIVEFRLQQLLREAQGLGWGTETPAGIDMHGGMPGAGSPSGAGFGSGMTSGGIHMYGPAGGSGAMAGGGGPAVAADQLARRLVEQWQAEQEEVARQELEDQLRATLAEWFRLRLERHEQEVAQLEERVEQLREQVERRRERSDDIVEFRLQLLLREAQGLGWGTDLEAASGSYGMMGAGRSSR